MAWHNKGVLMQILGHSVKEVLSAHTHALRLKPSDPIIQKTYEALQADIEGSKKVAAQKLNQGKGKKKAKGGKGRKRAKDAIRTMPDQVTL